MISTIIFDLDGVLIDAKPYHFKALNDALPEAYRISDEEHTTVYDGLPTFKKLELLFEKGMSSELFDEIIENKNRNFQIYLNAIKPDLQKRELFITLLENFQVIVCSNAICATVDTALKKIGIADLVQLRFSNNDVTNTKPSPEIYLRAMIKAECGPDECLIVEDSPVGLEAAYRSGAHVLRVDSPADVTLDKIMAAVAKANVRPVIWDDPKLNIVVPMAGSGKRFADAGYTTPKPLIPVHGKPMIQLAVDSLKIKGNFIFLVRERDLETCAFLKYTVPGSVLVPVKELTEGAACTTLLAESHIDNDNPLLIVNSDQHVDYDATRFFYLAKDLDASMLVFPADDKKWSYAEVKNGLVTRVAEKEVISSNATVGVYYWRRGSDYVKYVKQMIGKDIRVNGEFYVCPVFNEAIADGKRVGVFTVKQMLGMGTPEDLERNLVRLPS